MSRLICVKDGVAAVGDTIYRLGDKFKITAVGDQKILGYLNGNCREMAKPANSLSWSLNQLSEVDKLKGIIKDLECRNNLLRRRLNNLYR